MARLRGRRLDQMNRADMEALEQRVEAAALNRHIADEYDGPDNEDEPW